MIMVTKGPEAGRPGVYIRTLFGFSGRVCDRRSRNIQHVEGKRCAIRNPLCFNELQEKREYVCFDLTDPTYWVIVKIAPKICCDAADSEEGRVPFERGASPTLLGFEKRSVFVLRRKGEQG